MTVIKRNQLWDHTEKRIINAENKSGIMKSLLKNGY